MSGPPSYVRIDEGPPLPDVRGFAPFRAVVIIAADYTREWQGEVSAWLVDSGCYFMSAWGPDCTSWDDSVDWAHLGRHPDGASDDDFVFTTWHDKESLDSVFWFATFCADHPTRNELATLLIDISAIDREAEMLARFAAAHWLSEEEFRS